MRLSTMAFPAFVLSQIALSKQTKVMSDHAHVLRASFISKALQLFTRCSCCFSVAARRTLDDDLL